MLIKTLDSTTYDPTSIVESYWQSHVKRELDTQNWSVCNILQRINLPVWQSFLRDLPRDSYVECRWKRMSWLQVLENGDVEDMGVCAMAQGGNYNDANTMANKKRYYPSLEQDFLDRADVQAFVREWAHLWELKPREPILMQITGVKGFGCLDPLQGQGIHADGCTALSILVLSRENVLGATNRLYSAKDRMQSLVNVVLNPGDILHLRDDKLFHSVDDITQQSRDTPFNRFIIIINSRFVDPFQNEELRKCFPDAVIGCSSKKCGVRN